MTTADLYMKRLGRSAIALLLALWMLLLSACGKGDFSFESLLESDTGENGPCRIVIHAEASAELEAMAIALGEAIGESLDLSCVLIRGKWEHEEDGMTVFLGAQGIAEHDRMIAPLRVDGYLCALTESGALLLGGRNEEGTLRAAELYMEELLPLATEESLLKSDNERTVESRVPRERWSLNGFELWRYEIVLPQKANEVMVEIAVALQKRIAEESGYWLEIRREDEERGDRRLLLHGSYSLDGDRIAALTPDDMGLRLVAEDTYGASMVALELCRLLFEGEDRKLEINESYRLAYEREIWSLASLCNPYRQGISEPSQMVSFCDGIQRSGAEIVMLGGVDDTIRAYAGAMLSEYREHPGDTPVKTMTLSRGTVLSEMRMQWLNSEMTLTSYAVGADRDFYLVYISGCISNDWEELLPSWLEELDRPVVLILHCYEGEGDLDLNEHLSPTLEAAGIDRYTLNGTDYILACYARHNAVGVSFAELDSASGCRGITVYPTSALK